jgi:hypothetical protein
MEISKVKRGRYLKMVSWNTIFSYTNGEYGFIYKLTKTKIQNSLKVSKEI